MPIPIDLVAFAELQAFRSVKYFVLEGNGKLLDKAELILLAEMITDAALRVAARVAENNAPQPQPEPVPVTVVKDPRADWPMCEVCQSLVGPKVFPMHIKRFHKMTLADYDTYRINRRLGSYKKEGR